MTNFRTSFPLPFSLRNPRNSSLRLGELKKVGRRLAETVSLEQEKAVSFASDSSKKVWVYFPSSIGVCPCSLSSQEETFSDTIPSLIDFLSNLNRTENTKDTCPLCLGTGRMGGFVRFGSLPIFLSYIHLKDRDIVTPLSDRNGFLIQPGVSFEVSWIVQIPSFFERVLSVALCCNKQVNASLSVKNGGVTEIIEKDDLESFKGEEVEIVLSISNRNEEETEVFYLFLEFEGSPVEIPADMPLDSVKIGTMGLPEELEDNITVNFAGSAKDALSTEGLIVKNDGIVYRILSIEKHNPFNTPISFLTSCRLVRPFERYVNIPNPVVTKRYNPKLWFRYW